MTTPSSTNSMRLALPSSAMARALLLAVCVHALLFIWLDDFFKPKAYLADQTSYRVSVLHRSSESVEDATTPKPEASQNLAQTTHDQEPAKEIQTEQAVGRVEEQVEEKVQEKVKEKVEEKVALNELSDVEAAKTPESSPEVRNAPQEGTDAPAKPILATAAPASNPVKAQEREQQPEQEQQQAQATPPASAETSDTANVQATAQQSTPKKVEAEPKPTTEAKIAKVSTESEPEPEQVRQPDFSIGSANNPKPTYPQRARSRGWEGDVVLGVHVSADGDVTYVEILESSNVSALDFAAYTTVRDEWRFSPADEDERSLRGFVTVPISFRIN